jgi:hypothetical protein
MDQKSAAHGTLPFGGKMTATWNTVWPFSAGLSYWRFNWVEGPHGFYEISWSAGLTLPLRKVVSFNGSLFARSIPNEREEGS